MLVSCLQLNPKEDFEENLRSAESSIEMAVGCGAQVIVLPEMFTYMGAESERGKTASVLNEGVFDRLRSLALKHSVVLVAGSHSEKVDGSSKVYNTCVAFDQSGEMISCYRKIHLFNLRDPQGQPLYCESDTFLGGDKPAGVRIKVGNEVWNGLVSICYDVRFPEYYRHATEELGAPDVIFVTAAFTHQTGIDHWEVLLRARAIENQCYVVACNQTGSFFGDKKRNYGHSMIIDPWGRVLDRLEEETGILTVNIVKDKLTEVRQRLPALVDRKIFFSSPKA